MTESIHFTPAARRAAVGLHTQQMDLWSVLARHVHIHQKVRTHTPLEKLQDCFVNILAGGQGVVEINTRVRTDLALPRAFGRTTCAEQSTLSDTLNACTDETVQQLRAALTDLLRQHSRAYHHTYRRRLQLLDIDMTGLCAGR